MVSLAIFRTSRLLGDLRLLVVPLASLYSQTAHVFSAMMKSSDLARET